TRWSAGGAVRALRLGLITGAADDRTHCVGTCAATGRLFGPRVLWTAPVMLPMIATVVYLSSRSAKAPDNMREWIQRPQKIDTKNARPEMGVTDQDARDMTGYVYTLSGR